MGVRISNFKLLLHFSNIFHYFAQSYYCPVILRWTREGGILSSPSLLGGAHGAHGHNELQVCCGSLVGSISFAILQ